MIARHIPSHAELPREDGSLRACVEMEHLLLGELRELLDEQPDAIVTGWVLAVLDTLLELLPDSFAYEEHDGYLTDLKKLFPTWDNEVARLESERSVLYGRLRRLRRRIRRRVRGRFGQPAGLNQSDIGELRDWVDQLERHDHEQTDLQQAAWNLEIGGEA